MAAAAPVTTPRSNAPTKKRSGGSPLRLPAMQFVEAAMKVEGADRERLLDLAEEEQKAGLEVARHANDTAKRGQIFGLMAIILVLGLAGYMGSLGEAAWATVIAGIDVVSVAGVFVTGQVALRVRSAGR